MMNFLCAHIVSIVYKINQHHIMSLPESYCFRLTSKKFCGLIGSNMTNEVVFSSPTKPESQGLVQPPEKNDEHDNDTCRQSVE